MANPNEISRDVRNLEPAHFTLKIESYSLLSDALSNAQGEKFELGRFSAGGYQWKLILYPKGKSNNDDGKGHISLYLAIDKSTSFHTYDQKIYVHFKLFVRNKNTKWLTVQDASAVKYFCKKETERGFGKFLSLKEFNKEYLVNDRCTFGAEVFVIQPSPQKEILNMVKRQEGRSYPWKIPNFSKLKDEVKLSHEFTVEERKWRFYIYPNGNGADRRGTHLSLYMKLADWESVFPKRKVYAEYKLQVLDHRGVKNVEQTCCHWFNSEESKSHHFKLEVIKEHSNWYLKDDTLTVEVKFEVISKTSIAEK